MREFNEHIDMRYTGECFGKIQKDISSICIVIHEFQDIVRKFSEVGYSGQTFPKSVLVLVKEINGF